MSLIDALVENTVGKAAKKRKPDLSVPVVAAVQRRVGDKTINGKTFPLYAGINILMPNKVASGELGMFLHEQRLGEHFVPHEMVTYETLKDAVKRPGQVLWVSGLPTLTRTQVINLSTDRPGKECEGGVVFLIDPKTHDRLFPEMYKWIPLTRF